MAERSALVARGMVLAAGFGLRMRPLTLVRAKPALPVLNRPLIHWTLERLARAGVREVVVNLHYLPETVVAALRGSRRLGVRLSCSLEGSLLGTGGGPREVREFFRGAPALLVNGDVLFDLDLRALVMRHRESGARATLALRRNPDPRVYSPVVTDRRGRVLSIAGRPAPARGTVSLFAGVHVIDPALLARLPEGASDSVQDLYIPMLSEDASIQGLRLLGVWYDLGRPSLYRDVQVRLLPGGRPLVERSARIAASARLRRAVVGEKTRVGPGAVVERSVLWDGVTVDGGARVSDSVVTSGAVIRRGERAKGVIVLPAAVVAPSADLGAPSERHGDMLWVGIR